MDGEGQNQIVVVGAGGHAKVIIDCLRQSGWDVVGCTDSDPADRACAGVPVLGTDEKLVDLLRQGIRHAFCALGDNMLRERVGHELIRLGFDLPALRGPGAIVSSSATLGRGVVIMPGAVVNIDCCVGDFAILNTNSNVDHDGVIGAAAHIGPGASLAGEVIVGTRAFVATGAAVIPRCSIGSDTIVGAGSVVIGDLPANVVAFGNPASVKRSR